MNAQRLAWFGAAALSPMRSSQRTLLVPVKDVDKRLDRQPKLVGLIVLS